mgnify:CR=1 FL=1
MGIRRHIPNAITSCNLLSGVVGLVFAFSGRTDLAFIMMLAAGVFDFFDGFAARALKVSSPVGRELDSLSDDVSFGVLPAVMLFVTMGSGPFRWLTLLLAVFSALRLAKFNLDERQHDGFLGLPTPSAAILCGSIAAYAFCRPASWLAGLCATQWFLPLLAAALCALLVCEIPFFAFKSGSPSPAPEPGSTEPEPASCHPEPAEGSPHPEPPSCHPEPAEGSPSFSPLPLKRTAFFCIAFVGTIVTAVLGWHWTAVPLLVFASYILENLVFALFKI